MPNPAERRALLFIAGMAALGVLARATLLSDRRAAPDAASVAALDRQIGAVDAARTTAAGSAARGKARARRPPSADSADRVTRRSPPATPSRPRASPSAGPRVAPPDLSPAEARRREVERSNAAARARLESLRATPRRPVPSLAPPFAPPVRRSVTPVTTSGASTAAPRVNLDTAGPEAIATLPGIGPALAARIVEDRRLGGPFGSLEAVQRVRGVGPALAARIAPFVTFRGSAFGPPRVIEFKELRRPVIRP